MPSEVFRFPDRLFARSFGRLMLTFVLRRVFRSPESPSEPGSLSDAEAYFLSFLDGQPISILPNVKTGGKHLPPGFSPASLPVAPFLFFSSSGPQVPALKGATPPITVFRASARQQRTALSFQGSSLPRIILRPSRFPFTT